MGRQRRGGGGESPGSGLGVLVWRISEQGGEDGTVPSDGIRTPAGSTALSFGRVGPLFSLFLPVADAEAAGREAAP